MKLDKSFQEEKEKMMDEESLIYLSEIFPKELLSYIVEFMPSVKQRCLDVFVETCVVPKMRLLSPGEEFYSSVNIAFECKGEGPNTVCYTGGTRKNMRREWADWIEKFVEDIERFEEYEGRDDEIEEQENLRWRDFITVWFNDGWYNIDFFYAMH